MNTAQMILLVVLLLSVAAYLEVKLQKTVKPKASGPAPLNFDESYVIACLLQVSPETIYGASIRRNLDVIEDPERLRLQIREVCQSFTENEHGMRKVLGTEAFEAVSEYLDKYPFLISNRPVVPGGGRS